ncbi:MAG: EVE domain-containing protein [Geitlerinemataceae cyanobacterium]
MDVRSDKNFRFGNKNSPSKQETSTLQYWLLKSEPKTYSLADLEHDREAIWDGVRNYQARNFLRQMQPGDPVFFYHSNTNPPGIVGLARVRQSGIVDPTQFDPSSPYYDPKSTPNAPRWQTVEIEFDRAFPQMISLSTLKQTFLPDQLWVVKRGNRLSVMPVPESIALQILRQQD